MMKTSSNKPKISQNFSNREDLLSVNAALISQLQARLNTTRFRPQEGDSAKLGYVRALIQALQAQNAILKEAELEDI